MTQLTSNVIRGEEVKIAGRRQIGRVPAGDGPARTSGPIARLMEEDAAGAIIEVVCECGKRVVVRCEYGGATAPQPLQETEQ